jgi:hypothetical protein
MAMNLFVHMQGLDIIEALTAWTLPKRPKIFSLPRVDEWNIHWMSSFLTGQKHKHLHQATIVGCRFIDMAVGHFLNG